MSGQVPARGRGRGRSTGARGRGMPRRSGRPLNSSDRTVVMSIFSSLSDTARRNLVELLQGMTPPPAIAGDGPTNPPGGNPGQSGGVVPPQVAAGQVQVGADNRPRRVKPWEREILRDVPAIRDFGQMTAAQRNAHRDINQRISISAGVVSRGHRAQQPDAEILRLIQENWDDPDALRALFADDPEEDSSDEEIPIRGGADDPPGNLEDAAPAAQQARDDEMRDEDEEGDLYNAPPPEPPAEAGGNVVGLLGPQLPEVPPAAGRLFRPGDHVPFNSDSDDSPKQKSRKKRPRKGGSKSG